MNLNKNLLCLKWDEFDSFVVGGLSNLFQKDDMSDTTLFCDGRSFKAHKIILSMWSAYFREIFATATQPNTVIVLRETKSSDLELILRFIYQGQLFVPFEDTERFLKTAEYFQISGLRDMRNHLVPFGGGISTVTDDILTTPPKSSNSGSGSIAGGPSSSSSSSTPYHYDSNSTSTPGQGDSLPFQQAQVVTNSTHPQFSTPVIKSIPSAREGSTTVRNLTFPPPISPNISNSSSSSYAPNNNPPSRLSSSTEAVYSTQPILIVHNGNSHTPMRPEYPPQHSETVPVSFALSNKPAESRATSEQQVFYFERVSNGTVATKISTLESGEGPHPTAHNFSTNHVTQPPPSHEQEEILGLTYLQDTSSRGSSSSHSHIVTHSSGPAIEMVGNNAGHSSANSPPVQLSTSSPVYAVKRVPAPVVTTPEKSSASTSTSTSKRPAKTAMHSNLFKPKSPLRRQIRSHPPSQNNSQGDVEMVNCPKCDKRVKKTSLRVHVKRTHLEEGTVLVCPICGRQMTSKGVYYKHMYCHRQQQKGKGTGPSSVKSEGGGVNSSKSNSPAQSKESRS